MAQRRIREYDAKRLLAKALQEHLGKEFCFEEKGVLVDRDTRLEELAGKNPWLKKERLVVKPDQLFGKRGKHNLVLLDAGFNEAKKFIEEKIGKEVKIGGTKGKLSHFLVERFVPHKEEFFLAIRSERNADIIYFSPKGGIGVEEQWEKVRRAEVQILGECGEKRLKNLVSNAEKELRPLLAQFIRAVFKVYSTYGFAFLEINPLTIEGKKLVPLDMVARLDDSAAWECSRKWGEIEFPAEFGTKFTSEELFVKELDEKSGASLKLKILNEEGRVWTMVAGGGASVIYTDTIGDLGYSKEIANYGEYSGDPSEELTYEYAKTVLALMTKHYNPKGKILIIGGGIANFTDVASTFTGIVNALKEFSKELKKHKVRIFVRRGGPNYKEGIEMMKELGKELGIPIKAFGPELFMTKVVPMALRGAKRK